MWSFRIGTPSWSSPCPDCYSKLWKQKDEWKLDLSSVCTMRSFKKQAVTCCKTKGKLNLDAWILTPKHLSRPQNTCTFYSFISIFPDCSKHGFSLGQCATWNSDGFFQNWRWYFHLEVWMIMENDKTEEKYTSFSILILRRKKTLLTLVFTMQWSKSQIATPI